MRLLGALATTLLMETFPEYAFGALLATELRVLRLGDRAEE